MSAFPYDVEFETLSEGWNEYRLSDGAILKTKLTLGKVSTSPGVSIDEAHGFNFNTQTMIVAYVPQDMKGTPTGHRLSPQEVSESIIEDLGNNLGDNISHTDRSKLSKTNRMINFRNQIN